MENKGKKMLIVVCVLLLGGATTNNQVHSWSTTDLSVLRRQLPSYPRRQLPSYSRRQLPSYSRRQLPSYYIVESADYRCQPPCYYRSVDGECHYDYRCNDQGGWWYYRPSGTDQWSRNRRLNQKTRKQQGWRNSEVSVGTSISVNSAKMAEWAV